MADVHAANPEPATVPISSESKEMDVGSVFVSNYPPYSAWTPDELPKVRERLAQPPDPSTPFGLYLHIPFCRKRCKFCYFRVYTDKDAGEIGVYLDALAREVELASELPALAGRRPRFVYFGGGTPSYISVKQLSGLVARLQAAIPWAGAEEITFECEPGTLTQSKLAAIRAIGVTRLSLGVESFDDEVLRENGRAHASKEIFRVLPWIHELAFEQLNVDLIAGMVGETWETWREGVRKALEARPDSVTIYQMELPYNTVYSGAILDGTMARPIADWPTKRAFQDYAFAELAAAGYQPSAANTMVKVDPGKREGASRFLYRDMVWHGCDMLGTGVASFSHVQGVHFQNAVHWNQYLEKLAQDELPLARGLVMTPRERLLRELILQMKLGFLDPAYFRDKFGADVLAELAGPFRQLEQEGMLRLLPGRVEVTRQGLLQVDRLLPAFYEEQHKNARYT